MKIWILLLEHLKVLNHIKHLYSIELIFFLWNVLLSSTIHGGTLPPISLWPRYGWIELKQEWTWDSSETPDTTYSPLNHYTQHPTLSHLRFQWNNCHVLVYLLPKHMKQTKLTLKCSFHAISNIIFSLVSC